jgi:hypothetical protein
LLAMLELRGQPAFGVGQAHPGGDGRQSLVTWFVT